MRNAKCPTSNHETTPNGVCPECGQAASNGAPAQPTPPPEVANWHVEHATPDVMAWARQTFDEAEFLAAKREIERGGGHRFEDFIGEIERITNGGE